MIGNRDKGKEPELNQKSINTHVKFIDQAIKDIYFQLLLAMTGGGTKLKDTESVKVSLFRYLWEKLNKQNIFEFESVVALDNHYVTFFENLESYVSDFYKLPENQTKKIKSENQKLSDNKKKLFLELIKLYHLLAKIKFLLNKIKFLDLKTAFESISSKSSNIELNPIRETIDLLDALNEVIPAKLSSSGYLNEKSLIKKIKNLDEELLTFISGLLSKLPTKDQLNETIPVLKQARLVRNKHEINKHKKTLNDYIIQIQETKKMIGQKIIIFQQNENKLLSEMAEERNNIKIRILDIQHQDFFHVLEVLTSNEEKQKLQEIFAGIVTRCKQQSGQWIFNGPWENASVQLQSILKGLNDHYNNLMKDYVDLNKRKVAVLNALNSRIEQLDEISFHLEERLNKLRAIWQDSEQAITKIEDTLTTHLKEEESLVTYFKSFLSRHWWKLLLGGASGGGSSGGFSVLLALKGGPLALFCVIGTLVGMSLGAGSGLATDHMCPNIRKRKESTETDHLLPDEMNQELVIIGENSTSTREWWPSFSIWKGKQDNHVEQQNEFKLKPLGLR